MTSPFGGVTTRKGVALVGRTVLSGAPGANLTHVFDYGANGALELAKVTFPYGGTLRWTLGNIAGPNGQQVRGVNARYLKMSSGGTEHTYALSLNSGTGFTDLDDADGKSRKRWQFEISTGSAYYGLAKMQSQVVRPALTTMRRTDLTWTVNGLGAPYIQTQQTTIDVGQSYEKIMKSQQTVDMRGNLTESKLFDFGNLNTAKWVYNHTYLFTPNYETRFIWNRRNSTTLTFGGATVQYFTALYDGDTLTNRGALPLWDQYNFPVGMTYRGNLTSSAVPGFPLTTVAYDVTGMPVSVTQGGTTTQVTSYDAKNVAPTLITTGSLSMSTQYNQVYEVLQSTGPNGATTTAAYDTVARPVTETAATGAVVSYAYSLVAPQVTATVNGRWTKSYMDGLGRAVKVETGYGGTVVSTVETEYGPCGCSPMGKVMRATMPYAPGGTKHWTVYTYDAAGRVTNVALPNGAGSTMTAYTGNVTRVTSPAGKWKEQTVDAAGNVTKVTEPNPAGGDLGYLVHLRGPEGHGDDGAAIGNAGADHHL